MNFNNVKLRTIVWVGPYRPPSKKWVAENRKTHVVGIQLEGYIVHHIGNKNLHICAPCIYFLNQNDNYSVEVKTPSDQTKSYSIHFTTYEPIDNESFYIQVKNHSEIVALMEKINLHHSFNSFGNNLSYSLFYKILDLFETVHTKKYTPNDMRMISIRNYMDKHYCDKDCLEQAHALCNISRRRFNELFKKQFDITPNRYLVIKKVEKAKQLLSSTPLSVSEISEACGFSDSCYFCNVFKSETGYSPIKYRQFPIQ